MSPWKEHIDRFGFITQKHGDVMDSAQRMGMFWMAYVLMGRPPAQFLQMPRLPTSPKQSLIALEHPDYPGDYRRHPDPDHRGSEHDRLTRDQATGICALFLANSLLNKKTPKKPLLCFMWNMAKRLGFTNNKTWHGTPKRPHPDAGTSKRDWFGLSQWATCFRALGGWWFYPVYLLCDTELLFSAIKYRYSNKRTDVLNHTLRCCIAGSYCSTPWSWLANKFNKAEDIASRFRQYFTRTNELGDVGPPMHHLYSLSFLESIFHTNE